MVEPSVRWLKLSNSKVWSMTPLSLSNAPEPRAMRVTTQPGSNSVVTEPQRSAERPGDTYSAGQRVVGRCR